MAPVMLDRRVLAWRAKDVADEGLYQPEVRKQLVQMGHETGSILLYGAPQRGHVSLSHHTYRACSMKSGLKGITCRVCCNRYILH